ncbi:MAG: helix-turn-helix transcriptional regulator [Clostridia bacterium]|nr:helix-turn-helix transcriptional regulator [Clostridia bacterium]
MSLSQNIKRLRAERNLTQEQLALALGVSSQAVSKWETSDTYPDGALLIPLANQLGVSLDELFGNDSVYIADTAHRIMSLLYNTEAAARFNVARDICWQIEKGLFYARTREKEEGTYDPDDVKKKHNNSSWVSDDNGFTLISNGKEPFFSIFPTPEDNFGHFLEDRDSIQSIFRALSSSDTMTALVYLLRREKDYVFEGAVLAKECEISEDKIPDVIDDLTTLKVISGEELTINGKKRTLYYYRPSHKLIALFLVAHEIGYKGALCLKYDCRSKPFLAQP